MPFRTLFPDILPKIEKLEKQDAKNTIFRYLIEWFFAESGFELLDDASDEEYQNYFGRINSIGSFS